MSSIKVVCTFLCVCGLIHSAVTQYIQITGQFEKLIQANIVIEEFLHDIGQTLKFLFVLFRCMDRFS